MHSSVRSEPSYTLSSPQIGLPLLPSIEVLVFRIVYMPQLVVGDFVQEEERQ